MKVNPFHVVLKASLVAAFQIFYQVPYYAVLFLQYTRDWVQGLTNARHSTTKLYPHPVCVPLFLVCVVVGWCFCLCMWRSEVRHPLSFSTSPAENWAVRLARELLRSPALQQWGDGVMGMCRYALFYVGAMDLNLSKFYSLSHLHRPLSLGDRISWTLD